MRRFVMVLILVIVLVGVAPAAAQQNDTVQRNKDAVREALAQLSAGNPDGFFAIYANPFQMNQGDATLVETTAADISEFLHALVGAIPDLQATPEVLIAEGDWVAVELRFSGTFSQPYSFAPVSPDPIPATNQPVAWTEMDFLHFNADGKVDQMWSVSDPSYMFSQLGVMPAPSADEMTGTPVDSPVGYQTLSEDELAASYASGSTEQSRAQMQSILGLVLEGDTTTFYTDPYLSWTNGAPYQVTSAEALGDQEFIHAIKGAMPDAATSYDVLVVEGDWAAALVRVTGTSTNDLNLGEAGTFPATGQSMTWQIGIIDHFDANGKITEEWAESDATPMLTALGLMQAEGEAQ